MEREIIRIDEEKCNGCGDCVPNCPEGAIQIIDGKARLVSDLFCDGLGACLGHCPVGAITIEKREAEPYDEEKVMQNVVRQGPNVVRAHLAHLKEHGEHSYYEEAVAFLKKNGHSGMLRESAEGHRPGVGGCPGSRSHSFARAGERAGGAEGSAVGPVSSQLTHWPVQMHLINPAAEHFRGSDFLLAADCVAYALGNFHSGFLKGKTLAIACPKLDDGQDVYLEKLLALVEEARINSITVAIMQVPCCGGLLRLVQEVVSKASRKVPVKCVVVGIQGEILRQEWV
ncbi:MAG TPA: 4Fe-4S binding protein [Elusimicrobiota bacterium]|nr:4Fe-4S binding protein [Elusimicrobiota bacterium]